MSTVKISQLALITQLNANTSNTLFLAVDIPSGVTGKFTGHTLAQGLYSHEVLNVGNNAVTLPNTVAQFALAGGSYVQTNLINTDDGGTADIVVTANTGTDSTYFLDAGFANKDFQPGLEFNNLGTAIYPLDGYLYAAGQEGQLGGNLVIGSTTPGTDIKFIAGGHDASNIAFKATADGLKLVNGHPIYFTDNTIQNTAAAPFTYSNSSFAQANAAFIKANSAYESQNASGSYANSAFIKANNALANTTGTFGGDLSISGNLTTSGIVTLKNSTFNPNTTFVSIVASDNFAVAAPSNTNYMLQVTGKANSVTRVVFDSFGQNSYPLLAGRMGRGSAAAPAAIANNDIMMRIVGNGYTGTQFPSSSPTKIDFVASEDFSDTNRGTRIEFWNTPAGSNTIQKIASFNANEVSFSGHVTPQKGFVYTPRVLQGAQTAITIDFSTDSIIRGTFNSSLTNSFTNYTAGKVVEMWLTNTAGNGQTVTHGCLANNATNGATSVTVASGRSVLLKYFSIDGDQANTFVAVTYG